MVRLIWQAPNLQTGLTPHVFARSDIDSSETSELLDLATSQKVNP